MIDQIRPRIAAVTDKPVLLGLGISNAEQAVEASGYADGVIVGSALVAAPAEGRRPRRRARVRRRAPRRARRFDPSHPRDQVPRFEAAAGAGARRDLRATRRTRPRSTCSPARRASRRSSSGAARTSPRSTPRATPRCSRSATSRSTPTPSTRTSSPTRSRDLAVAARRRRLLHRDVLRAVALLPAVQRRARSTRSATRSSATTRTSPLYPVLLTSLIEAADRVDSTTGVQMAYVKQWAPRSYRPLELRVPELLAGRGRGGARPTRSSVARTLGHVRPRVPRPAVQPAPLLHELPRLGDARRVGRARALRRRVQARRRPRPGDEERRSTSGGRCRTRSRGVVRDVDAESRGRVVQRRVVGDARRAARRCARCAGAVEVLALRLEALRRRADRHPQPERREGGHGLAPAQRRVRPDRRRAAARSSGSPPPPGRGCRMADADRGADGEGRRVRPLRGGADHAVVPRGRRVLDRRVRDLLRADGRVAVARHGAAGRPPRAHARAARPRSPPRRSSWSTGSTTTCATSPTTTTRTPGRGAASSATAIAAPDQGRSRSRDTRLATGRS